MALSDTQVERYARHIVLKEIGGMGQQKLLSSRVLVIGAGGLGAPCLMYLAAAGVGTVGIIDDDVVALTNLQRQIIHDTNTIGIPKVESATQTLSRLNPDITIVPYTIRLEAYNAMDIINSYDIVADGSDNFETRLLVNDACYLTCTPLVSAAVGRFDGQLATFRSWERDEEGVPYPNYRCLVPHVPSSDRSPPCEEAGIIGALTGVMGSLQAMEVIKEITGIGSSLKGRLLLYDALEMRIRIIRLRHDAANPLTGDNPTIHDLSSHV
ncbi:MAG: molybdopterin-synthase adenylyltransferase MoeB [Parvularculales bacterium]